MAPASALGQWQRKEHDAEALEYRETQGIDPEELVELEAELAEIGVSFEEDEDP